MLSKFKVKEADLKPGDVYTSLVLHLPDSATSSGSFTEDQLYQFAHQALDRLLRGLKRLGLGIVSFVANRHPSVCSKTGKLHPHIHIALRTRSDVPVELIEHNWRMSSAKQFGCSGEPSVSARNLAITAAKRHRHKTPRGKVHVEHILNEFSYVLQWSKTQGNPRLAVSNDNDASNDRTPPEIAARHLALCKANQINPNGRTSNPKSDAKVPNYGSYEFHPERLGNKPYVLVIELDGSVSQIHASEYDAAVERITREAREQIADPSFPSTGSGQANVP